MRQTVPLRILRKGSSRGRAEPSTSIVAKVVALAHLSAIVHGEYADVIRFRRTFCEGLHSDTDGFGEVI